MKPSALFGLIVRVIGLMTTMYAAWQIPFAFFNMVKKHQLEIRYVEQSQRTVLVLFCNIVAILVGLWLLRGAKSLISFAYPDENQGGDTEQGN